MGVKETFLRRPAGRGEVVADALRVAVAVSVVVAGLGWGAVEVAVFMLALLGVLVPRALGVRATLDTAIGVSLLVASWSNVFDLYTFVIGWDKIVHFVLNGLIAALAIALIQRSGLLPSVAGHRRGLVLMTVAIGLATGALWEMGEWAGHTFVDRAIVVGYNDTVGDLAADGAGALAAGFALPFLVGHRSQRTRRSSADSPRPTPGQIPVESGHL